MWTIGRQLKEERGAEIAEAAVVLPIAFMFLLGIVWFGRAFNIYSTITRSASVASGPESDSYKLEPSRGDGAVFDFGARADMHYGRQQHYDLPLGDSQSHGEYRSSTMRSDCQFSVSVSVLLAVYLAQQPAHCDDRAVAEPDGELNG